MNGCTKRSYGKTARGACWWFRRAQRLCSAFWEKVPMAYKPTDCYCLWKRPSLLKA